MSCVACGKPIGFSNDGVKFCSSCSDLVRKQRKCEIPGCNSMTEAFYTQCTYHYHRLQKEIRLAHSRKMHSPQPPQQHQPPPRPYRSTHVATAPERRRVSRSPPPRPAVTVDAPRPSTQSKPKSTMSSSSQPPVVTEPPTPPPVAESTPAPAAAAPAKAAATTAVPLAAATTTKTDASASARRVMKRTTDPSTTNVHCKRPRHPTTPNVIVEYECNACGAVNVVTREVRFLQTFVVRDTNHNAAGAEDANFPAVSAACDSKSALSQTDEHREEDAESEVNAILNCKDAGIDDCEFQVNIPNAATTTK